MMQATSCWILGAYPTYPPGHQWRNGTLNNLSLGHTPELRLFKIPFRPQPSSNVWKRQSATLTHWKGQDQYKTDLSVPEFQTSSVACMQQAKIDHVHRAPFYAVHMK